MRTLIFLITIITATTLVRAEENDEIIWETEQIGGINDVLVSPLGDIFYNVTGSTIQIRSIEDGTLIDYFIPDNMPNHITHISITDDGRYMAMSGDNPHIVIYDLVEEREVKRLTTTLLEREENGKIKKYLTDYWHNSSISPDGTKVTGIAEGDQATGTTSWVVFDLETGEELVKETKIRYDYLNPDKPGAGRWISTEFSPDGSYVVSQSTWSQNGEFGQDSIYIHDANTFEIYDVILNSFDNESISLALDKSSRILLFYYFNGESSKYFTYSLNHKIVNETELPPNIFGLTFFRNYNKIIYGFDFDNQIYSFENNSVIYNYDNPKVPRTISLDDKVLLSTLNGKIYGMRTSFSETSIEQDYEEEIIIAPNPTNSSVNITYECNEPNIDYRIYNINSILMIQSSALNKENSFSLDFSTYPTGTYFLSFICNDEMKMYKIVKEG